MKTVLVSASSAMAALAVLCSVAQAADAPPPTPAPNDGYVPDPNYHPPAKRISPADGLIAQVKPRGPTPTSADGHPDLTGIWGGGFVSTQGRFHIRSFPALEPDQAAMQRGNYWNRPLYKPELWEKVHSLDFSTVEVDPDFRCLPHGAPRSNAPAQIIQTPKQVVLIYGEDYRVVPTDGRKRDPGDTDFDNWYGVPLGHWEGDTLVVESVGFNDESWLQWPGFFHTDKMSLVERFRRQGDLLLYQFTVTDPDVLAQPWTSDTYVKRLNPNPTARIEEPAPCKENDVKEIADKYFRG